MGWRPLFMALIAALCLPGSFVASAQAQTAPAAAEKPVPDWYVRGVAAALLDPTPGMPAEIMKLPRVKEALGAIANSDAPDNERQRITQRLPDELHKADEKNQLAAASALAAIGAIDFEQRKTVVDLLVKLEASGDLDFQKSAAAALGAINSSDAQQRRAIVETLVTLAARSHRDVRQSAFAALVAVTRSDPERRKSVAELLISLAASSDVFVQDFAAAALGAINPSDPDQRKTVVETLVKLAISGDDIVRPYAAAALGAISPSDPVQRKTVVETLIKLTASDDLGFQQSAAVALGAINPSDPEQRKAVVDTLVKLAGSGKSVRVSAAAALGVINPSDPEQRKTVIETLVKLAAIRDSNIQSSAAVALGAVNTSDPEQRKTVVDTLVKLAVSKGWNVPQFAVDALGAVNPSDPDQRKTVVDTLVRLAASGESLVRQSVAAALGAMSPGDPDQRKTVVDTLIKLAADGDLGVQVSTAAALGAIDPSDQEQRHTVVDALVNLAASRDSGVQRSTTAALLATAPIDADQVVHVLVQINQDSAQATPRWRAIGWAFNDAPPKTSDGTINEGATLMTFAGHPTNPSDHMPKDPNSAAKILRVFANYWPKMQASETLQNEIAQQAVAIVSLACPVATVGSGAGVLEGAAERVAQEWERTLAWLHSLAGGQDRFRCWQGDDQKTLHQLRDDFSKVVGLDAETRALNETIAADDATPFIGRSVLAVGGWALIWTAFVVAFPYSARVRGAYLYDKKFRGWLSLKFLPAIMILIPPLRRRMLLPFRDELLADAHLALLKEAEFYPALRVRNREGRVQPIGEAIPDIRGKLLLIGESGLGKSTFLRVLASRSPRTVAYLNARSCDKGVEAAIVQRVSGFESSEFFKGLIYAGDLAVVIDGLNEVSADVRAGVVAFANGAGRANLAIATQPIEGLGGDRSPLTLATPYQLLPLAREDIAKFLKSRPARNNPASLVKGEDYDRAVDRLLAKALDRALDSEAEREAEAVLQERRAAELILSNPMDLTYGSELIALGETPQPSQMIGQAFRLAREQYRATYDRDFPELDFARKAVALRREDRNWLKPDEFGNEQGVLAQFRLIVPRSMNETADKQVTVMRFRHDKVMDVLTKRAFEVDEKLQVEFLDDPRFRGVYLLFAQGADRDLARRIRDRVVSRAARTGDNGLSNEFVRLFDRGPVEHADA